MKHVAFPLLAVLAAAGAPATKAPAPAHETTSEAYELVPIPESAVHHAVGRAPRIRQSNGTSTNWSGYAIPTGSTTDVRGSWVVPHTAPSASDTTWSSTWVGIDGYDTNTVEQTGTEDDWTGGQGGSERHYAWFEMYPRSAFLIKNFPVSPDDVMSAEVKYTGRGNFTLTLRNVTQNKSFTTSKKLQSAKLGSAEWVVEAPWSGGVLPLADFGQVTFSSCSATIDGHTGPIGDAAWTPEPITMVTSDGSTKAAPSSLGSDGFTVTWSHE